MFKLKISHTCNLNGELAVLRTKAEAANRRCEDPYWAGWMVRNGRWNFVVATTGRMRNCK